MSPRDVDGKVRARSSAWLLLSASLHGTAWLVLVMHDFRPHAPPPLQRVLEFQLLELPEDEGAPSPTEVAAAEKRTEQPAATAPAASQGAVHASNRTPARDKVESPRPVPQPTKRKFERQTAEPSLTIHPTPSPSDPVESPSKVAPPGDTPTWSTLDPRAAALTLVDPSDEGSEPSPEQRLNEAIALGATRPVDKRPEPVLRPGPNGGYLYSGNGFEATIAPNGELTMKDRYGSIVIPLVPYQTPDGSWRIGLLGGTFRLYEWLDRKFGKNDPYLSERRWFLERTRELRERLQREHAPNVKRGH